MRIFLKESLKEFFKNAMPERIVGGIAKRILVAIPEECVKEFFEGVPEIILEEDANTECHCCGSVEVFLK